MIALNDARLRRPRGATFPAVGTPFGGGQPGAPPGVAPTGVPAPVNTDTPPEQAAWNPTVTNTGSRTDPTYAPTAAGAPGASPYGYAATGAYGPGADLRGTQISPTDSAATTGANAAATGALGAYTGFQAAPWQGVAAGGAYTPAADTTGLRSSLSQALAALQTAPDRGQLAAGNFALLDQTAKEATARDLRDVGASAAKFGRIGSGLTTSNLGDLGERQALARSRAQSQMSLDAAGQTMGDRLNIAGAIGSGFNTLSGADLAGSNQNLALRGEARGERDARGAYDAADFSRRGQLFGDTATYAGQQAAQDAARRGELRGERTYQGGQEQTAYDRARQARTDAAGQQNDALNQALRLLTGGSGGDLTGALQSAGQTAGAQGAAGQDALAQLLAQYFGRRG
jgi:hypothetical protein